MKVLKYIKIDVDGTDWNAKPSNVPDYMMTYRHVARAIAPNFNGYSFQTPILSGETLTECYEFTIDPAWDISQMHIVGMLINNTGMIDNASSSFVSDALAAGINSFCNPPTGGIYLEGPEDNKTQLYPNPAINKVTITNLPEKTISIEIFTTKGEKIMDLEKQEKIDIEKLPSGVYQIKIKTPTKTINRKLVKNQ